MRLTFISALSLTASLVAGAPEPVKVDVHGDPLPGEAVLRLGKVRFGHWPDLCAPGSKSVVCVRFGVHIREFDRRTGRLTGSRTLPAEPCYESHLSRDGSHVLLCRRPPGFVSPQTWEVWDLGREKKLCTIRPDEGFGSFSGSLSPDGRFVVAYAHRDSTADQTSRVAVWDARTGEQVGSAKLQVPAPANGGSWMCHPRHSADGRSMVFGTGFGKSAYYVCLDAKTLAVRWERTATGDLGSYRETPDGRLLFPDGTAVSITTGEESPFPLPPDFKPGSAVGFANGGAVLLYTVPFDRTRQVKGWDWKLGKPAEGVRPFFLGEGAGLWGWSDVGGPEVLISDRTVRAIDLRTGKPLWADTVEAGHHSAVTALVFSADGRRLASAGDDRLIHLCDTESGRPLGRWSAVEPVAWPTHGGPPGGTVLDLSADGRRLVFEERAHDGMPRLRVIDAATGRTIRARTVPGDRPAAGRWVCFGRVGLARDGDAVLASHGNSDNWGRYDQPFTLSRWDLTSDSWTDFGPIRPSPPNRSAVGPGTAWLSSGSAHSLVSGREAFELVGSASAGPLTLSADGRLIAGVGRRPADPESPDGRLELIQDVRVWDSRTGFPVACLPWEPPARPQPEPPPSPHILYQNPLLGTWPRHLALHPTGRLLATSDSHGVRIWDLATERVMHTVPVPQPPPIDTDHGSPATALAFTPDGTRLATGLPDGTILFWPVPVPKRFSPRADELPALGTDLSDPDPAKGWRAVWRLMDDPATAVRLIREKVKPAELILPTEVAKLLADVDAPDFRRREVATRRLIEVIDRVRPAVIEAEKTTGASPELRERLRKVLDAAPGDDRPLPPRMAALSRAIAVLEHVRTPDAVAALKSLAAGSKGAWLTREAETALERLSVRPSQK